MIIDANISFVFVFFFATGINLFYNFSSAEIKSKDWESTKIPSPYESWDGNNKNYYKNYHMTTRCRLMSDNAKINVHGIRLKKV